MEKLAGKTDQQKFQYEYEKMKCGMQTSQNENMLHIEKKHTHTKKTVDKEWTRKRKSDKMVVKTQLQTIDSVREKPEYL